jgi:hypothetical protein
VEAGWVEYYSPKLPDGTNSSTSFRVGRQLKRLLIMLTKSRTRKKPRKSDDKERWQFSPLKELKKLLLIQEKEKEPPSPETLRKNPLLKRWLERGSPPEKMDGSKK